jgi:hypothetical protein
MGPVSDAAAYLFSEFDRLRILQSQFLTEDENFFSGFRKLNADPAAKRQFEAALAKTQQLADAEFAREARRWQRHAGRNAQAGACSQR